MFTPRDVIFGAAVPALVGLVILLAAWRPWRAAGSAPRGLDWGGPLALCAGFLAGYAGIFSRPPFPPLDSVDWLFYLTIPLAVAALAVNTKDRALWLVGIAVIMEGLSSGLLTLPLWQHTWSPVQGAAWVGGLEPLAAVTVLVLSAVARQSKGLPLPVAYLVLGGLAALTLLLSGSQKLGQLGGALAAALGPVLLLAWWSGRPFLSRGASLTLAILYLGLLAAGHFYASLTPLNGALLAAAPLAAGVGLLPPLRRLRPLFTEALQALSVLAPAIVAVALAAIEFRKNTWE